MNPENHTEGQIVHFYRLLGEAIELREFYRAAMLCLSLAKELLFAHSNAKQGEPMQGRTP